jgi:hypothetical protein
LAGEFTQQHSVSPGLHIINLLIVWIAALFTSPQEDRRAQHWQAKHP